MTPRKLCPLCLTEVHHAKGYFPRMHRECAYQAYVWSTYGFPTPPMGRRPVLVLGPTCYLCGVEPSRDVEHVVPRALGGHDEWGNIGAACSVCNSIKGARIDAVDGPAIERLAVQEAAYKAAFERVRGSATSAVVDVACRTLGSSTIFAFPDGDPMFVDEVTDIVVDIQMDIEISLLEAQWHDGLDDASLKRDIRERVLDVSTAALSSLLPQEPRGSLSDEVQRAVEDWPVGNDVSYAQLLLGVAD